MTERLGSALLRWKTVAAALAGALVLAGVLSGLRLDVGRDLHVDARTRTSPVAGRPVPPVHEQPAARIAATGDTGTGSEAQHRTARRMLLESRERAYDALVLLGDLVYEDGDASLVEHVVLSPFSPVMEAGAALVPVLGNHDYESGEQEQILAALGRAQSWYVHRSGPVRLIVLDSNRVDDDAQLAWLRRTLREPVAPETWTVVAMHHPAYSAGHHGSDMSVRKRWGPLFADHGVRLVLAGHDHDYQRSTVQDGVTYVVSGAGAKLRATGRLPFTAVSSSTLHYLDVLVYEDRLVGRAIDHSGRLVDEFTIRRDRPLIETQLARRP